MLWQVVISAKASCAGALLLLWLLPLSRGPSPEEFYDLTQQHGHQS